MNKNKWGLFLAVFAGPILVGTMNLFQGMAYAKEKVATALSDRNDMEKVLSLYSRIHKDLVTDSRGQIKDDASLLLVAARKVKDEKLSSDIQDAAKRMISDSSTGMGHPSIPQSTDDFKKLSAPIVDWVKKNKPTGWIVVHCSMLDASWVQKKDQEVQNPYSGKEMRSCGDKE